MLSSHPDDLQSQSHFLILTKRRYICIQLWHLLCNVVLPPRWPTVHVGPKRKRKVRKSRNENLSISAALLLVTALSAASSSLSASVIASLMSSIIRTARTGAGQDAASLTAQQTHTPLSYAQLSRGTQGWISQMHFKTKVCCWFCQRHFCLAARQATQTNFSSC